MAKKRAAAAEDPQVAANNVATDDVAECYVEYTEYMGAIARTRQKIATMLARYENMGVHTKSVRACYRLANMDDAPDYVREMLRTAAILKIIPAERESDGQMTFLPGLTVAPPSPGSEAKLDLAKAFWAGHDAGRGGTLIEACPHQAGSEAFVKWRDGWEDGRKEWAAKPKNQNVTAAPKVVRARAGRAADKPAETALEKDEADYRGPVTLAGTKVKGSSRILNDEVTAALEEAGVEVVRH